MTNSQLYITNERNEVSPLPAGDHKAQINRSAHRSNIQRYVFSLQSEILFQFLNTFVHIWCVDQNEISDHRCKLCFKVQSNICVNLSTNFNANYSMYFYHRCVQLSQCLYTVCKFQWIVRTYCCYNRVVKGQCQISLKLSYGS